MRFFTMFLICMTHQCINIRDFLHEQSLRNRQKINNHVKWVKLCERIEGLDKSKTRDRLRVAGIKRAPHAKGADGNAAAPAFGAPTDGASAAETVDHTELVQAWCSDRSVICFTNESTRYSRIS